MVAVAVGKASTLKVTSSVETLQEPSAAIVYLIFIFSFEIILAGVYVFPLMVPFPDTIDHVPPAGFPVNVLVSTSDILADAVVLLAVKQIGVTVKVTSSVVWAQDPLLAIVYLIFTVVFVLMSLGV